MGLHHHLAVGLLAVLIWPMPLRAQWREWVDLRTAVEDIAGALEERLECTFQGIQTIEYQACIDGSAQETATNVYRAYGISLDPWVLTNTPIAWSQQGVKVSAGTNMIVHSVETQEWLTATGTVQAVYTNWMTQDFSVTTNADCEVVTSEFASVVWTSPPPHNIPAPYMEALDAAIVTLSNPEEWGLYDPALFDPAGGCVTGWMWTVRDQWEPWSYTYPAAPDLLTHSQLCVRAGLTVTTYVDTVTDRGDTYPRTVSGGTYLYGWEVGDYGTKNVNIPKPSVIQHRYVTNAVTVGLWNYAPLYAMSNTAREADGSTVVVGRVLGRLSSARGASDFSGYWKWQVRGLGAGVDGVYSYAGASGTWTGQGHYAWYPTLYGVNVGGRYISKKAPEYPGDWFNPESNALWMSAGILQDSPDPLWPWQERGLAGCYTPVQRPDNTVTTTGDVAPVAAWKYDAGEAVWGVKSIILQPAALPAYLWVTILSTNDRYCAGLPEPDAFPDPLTVKVVGTWWRSASATQGLVSITSTQLVDITSAGRVPLAYPFTAIASMTPTSAIGRTDFYSRELEITAHLGDYTNALSMINAPAASWLNSGTGWEAFKPVLEDRKKLLSAMAGLSLLIPKTETNLASFAASTNLNVSGQYGGSDGYIEGCYGLWFIEGSNIQSRSGDQAAYEAVPDECLTDELKPSPTPQGWWSVSSMCEKSRKATGGRYDSSFTQQEGCYGINYGSSYGYEASIASTFSKSKSQRRWAVTITDRVPLSLSFYQRAKTESSVNVLATEITGRTLAYEQTSECGVTPPAEIRTETGTRPPVVRPTFYGVSELIKYKSVAAGSSFGVYAAEHDVSPPEWPETRLKYMAHSESYSMSGGWSWHCYSEDVGVDENGDRIVWFWSDSSESRSSSESLTYSREILNDAYEVEGVASIKPEWRFR